MKHHPNEHEEGRIRRFLVVNNPGARSVERAMRISKGHKYRTMLLVMYNAVLEVISPGRRE